jgi:hypothetical protein
MPRACGIKLPVAVQTGDLLDRGNDDRALLDWLEKVAQAAERAGGHLYRINGNHEIINVQGDFRYVSEHGFLAYADQANTGRPEVMQFTLEQRGRAAAFLPGGTEANRLAQYPVVLIVGDTVFAHGGVLHKHLRYGLDRMNTELAAWMRAERQLPAQLRSDDSPFWTRDYGDEPVAPGVCASLGRVLAGLGAARLVVGHTPQKSGISFACGQHLARIDVGMSAAHGGNPPEVLEIAGGNMRVLSENAPSTQAQVKAN